MHYYQRNVGAYTGNCGHLTLIEHGVYTLLLDRLYISEKPITERDALRVCRPSTEDERAAVGSILREFFTETEDGWVQKRAMEEIAAYQAKASKNRKNGKLGGRKPAQPQPNPNQDGNHDGSHDAPQDGDDDGVHDRTLNKKQETGTKDQELPGPLARKLTLAQWIAGIPEGDDILPETDPIYGWATEQGLPDEWITMAWRCFANRYVEGTGQAKRYIDWRAAFRNALKDDWLKLWHRRGQDWALTTAGENWRQP